jgi:hypothetical protein
MVLETGTDVVGHINGGHSALPDDQIVCLCESCKAGLEIVHNGNERAALLTLNTARGAHSRHPEGATGDIGLKGKDGGVRLSGGAMQPQGELTEKGGRPSRSDRCLMPGGIVLAVITVTPERQRRCRCNWAQVTSTPRRSRHAPC